MSKSSRQSQVQTRILIALNRGSLPTVAEIARQVQVSRPSAHRSVKSLMEKNLVIRDAGKWKLTRSGNEAAASAQKSLNGLARELLAKTVKKATGLSVADSLSNLGKLSWEPSALSMESLNNLGKPSWEPSALGIAGLGTTLAESLSNLGKLSWEPSALGMAGLGSYDPTKGFVESSLWNRDALSIVTPALSAFAMDSLLQVQKKQNDLLGSALLSGMSSPLTIDLGQSNRILSGAVQGLSVMIHESMTKPLFDTAFPPPQSLFNQLVDVTKSYHSYMDEQLGFLSLNLEGTLVRPITVLPTAALADCVSSVRAFATMETEIVGLSGEPSRDGNPVQGELDCLLAQLGPYLVDMRRGAWDTFYSRGRDRFRQATHLMRELINSIIHTLAPDSSFDAETLARLGKRPSRVMRLKRIANGSKSTGEYIECLARSVDAHYDELSNVAHANLPCEMSVRLILETAERAMLLLLLQGPFKKQA